MGLKRWKYLILGAGPTGLGAAYRLKELGVKDFLILEKENFPGGLATSFKDDRGFTWDIGGHVQFSHYQYFDKLMEKALGKEGWLHHQRESWAWIENRWVPYPVQNNIRYLTKETLWKCLEGIITANQVQRATPPANFREWIQATFGPGLAEVFLNPYNYKVWAYPPEDMAYHWIGERVAVTDLKRVTQNILFEKDDLSWGPNNTFQFPKFGGTGEIWNKVANLVGEENFKLGANIVEVDTETKTVKTSDGLSYAYENLLSTLPLDMLCERIRPNLSENLIQESKKLIHSSSHIIGVGLKGKPSEDLKTKCWMYFPENNCPFYRVTVFSNYSPNNVPDISKYWSLMTETSESPKKPVNRETLVEETIQGLLNTRLIESRDQIASTWSYCAGYGYPTPSLKRDEALKVLLPYLDRLGVYSRGRFGAWKYEVSNQDHSMMQGVEWASWMELGIPEVTVRFPEMANRNWGRS